MSDINKHKCGLCCENTATWQMSKSPSKIRVKYFCDKCLPRKMKSGFSFQYNSEGFSKGCKKYYITYDDVLECFDYSSKGLSLDDEFEIQDKFGEIFLCHTDNILFGSADYNKVMSQFGDYLVNRCSSIFNIELVDKYRKFYVKFKESLNSKKFLM